MRRTVVTLIGLGLVVPALTACGSLRGMSIAGKVVEHCYRGEADSGSPSDAERAYRESYACQKDNKLLTHTINLDTFRLPSSENAAVKGETGQLTRGPLAFATAFYGPAGKSNSREQVRARDYLQDEIMRRSEVMCAASRNKIYAADASFGFGFLTLATITSGVAAIVNGDEAVRILSAVSSMSIGTNSILESEVFKDQLVSTLFAQIESERKQMRISIEARRDASRGDISKYTAPEAIGDAVRFHRKCDLISAMTGLSKTIRENENRGVIQKRYETRLLEEELMSLTGELDKMPSGDDNLALNVASRAALKARIIKINEELGLIEAPKQGADDQGVSDEDASRT